MNQDNVTAVLFDWDFTLAYTLQKDISPIERTAVLFQKEGADYSAKELQVARRSLLRDIALGEADGNIKPQAKEEIMQLYQDLLRRLGHPDTSQDLASRIYQAYGRLPTTLYDDVLPTLQTLHKQGIKLGILSNHAHSVRATMEKLVGGFIDGRHITISEEENCHKPEPKIFKTAVDKLKVPPRHCLYVGDNLQVDAIGAVEHGRYRRGLWLDRHNKGTMQDVPENVIHITFLQQVLDFL